MTIAVREDKAMAQDAETSSASRLIIVSNRLPVTIRQGDEGDIAITRSAGGLATALARAHTEGDSVWIGWPGDEFDNPETQKQITTLLREQYRCVPVFLSQEDIDGFYYGFSNRALWPLFHYFESYFIYDEDAWESYAEVNRLFCDVIVEHARGDELIWVHDYQLFLLPGMLRQHLPEARIGFFLHIPFPSSELFRILPCREALLRGLLGADLIGFQTFNYLQNFLWSVYRVLGIDAETGFLPFGGRQITFGVYPIGVDPQQFLTAIHTDSDTQRELARLDESIEDRKLLLGMDRLDYSKGIPARLRAYRRFLTDHPEWHERVTLLQVAVPSREQVPAYQELKRQVDELVGEINGVYGTTTWIPVQYVHRNLPFPQICALLRRADVALVTPLRDGMNLVAKEYVACQEERPGALIIAEFAGASAEMGEAFFVNPYDEEGMAARIYEVLSQPETVLRERMATLHKRVCTHTVEVWADRFLGALTDIPQSRLSRILTGPEYNRMLVAYRQAHRRVFLLDYDGTLSPLVGLRHHAAPDAAVVELLQDLQSDPRNVVAVVSSRDRYILEQWLGECGCFLAAEHGAWFFDPAKHAWQDQIEELNDDWKSTVRPLLENVVEQTPGSVLEEKQYSLAWHYRLADPEFALWQARELSSQLQGMLAGSELQVQSGHKVVEVKWAKVHKGLAAAHVLEQAPEADFILAIGDDHTDEDLFAAVPEDQWTVKVGMGVSSARFALLSPAEVIQLLRDLARTL
jgi:trehalose 6-phosphate synthase/phosphatase